MTSPRDEASEDADAVVVRLYDAALDPRQWPSALAQTARLVGGVSAAYVGAKSGGRRAEDLKFAYTTELLGEALARVLIEERSQRVRTASVCTGRLDSFYSMTADVDIDGVLDVTFAVLRPERRRPFGSREKTLFASIASHLTRVGRLQLKLGVLRAERDALLESIDHVRNGVIFVDRNGRVTFSNRAAKAIIDENDGLSIEQGRLRCAAPDDTKSLRDQLRRARSGKGLVSREGLERIGVSRPSRRRPWVVTFVPCGAARSGGRVENEEVVAFVTDPEVDVVPTAENLRTLYALTPTETMVAQLVAGGIGLPEVAKALGVSINTARTHLKRVFEKTGTRRQAELVKVLVAGLPPVTDAK